MKAQNLNELLAWQPPHQQYIIDRGILVPQTKLILYGKWESWKSMLAMHTAFMITMGMPWFGFSTTKTPVYTLQIEIPKAQFQNRVAKYVKHNQLFPDNLYFRTEYFIKLDKTPYLVELERELEASACQVLMVDPAYKVLSGQLVDEMDVRRFIDGLDLLIDKLKLTLIMIHHDRKTTLVDGQPYSSPDDMFGSSIFIDWCDTAIRSSKTSKDGEVILSFDKVRHAEEELKPITVRVDRATLKFGLAPTSVR